MRNGWVAPVGPELDLFESRLAVKFHFPNVLALSSGTAALHLAVKLAGVGAGDRVLIGTFTFVAAANAVLYERGVPVFLDSELESWNLDPELLESYLKDHHGKPTFPKAVIVTHIFGRPAQIQRIAKTCRQYGVKLIEDAAEALGTEVEGGYAGNFGDYGVLSFNGNKIITTGGGGALVCKWEDDHCQARHWATQAKEEANHFLHTQMGYNYRLSNVLAGLGLAQLEAFDEICDKKHLIARSYAEALSDVDWLEASIMPGSNDWVAAFLIRHEALEQTTPDLLMSRFSSANIEARRFWKPMHLQPLFERAESSGGETARNLFDRGICLPSGAGLTGAQLRRVVEVLRTF